MRALVTGLVCVAGGMLAIDARADDRPPPKNVVLADLGLHVVGVGYERVLSRGVAVQGDLEWYVPWTQGSPTAVALMGVALRTRLFFHPGGNALFHHLHLSIGLGAQYNAAAFGLAQPPSYARFYPTVDGTVGYAF